MVSAVARIVNGALPALVVMSSLAFGESCVSFLSPLSDMPIFSPVCTLLVDASDCERKIRKVEFAVRYFPENSDTSTVMVLGAVQRPPYLVPWDIALIPNQVFTGATVYADVTFNNEEVVSLVRDGIYCIHQQVNRPIQPVPFDFSGSRKMQGPKLELVSGVPDVKATATVYWNKKELVFLIDVVYPVFSSQMASMSEIGAEILIDPLKSRTSFPESDVFLYTVPLRGKPFRTLYKKSKDENGNSKVAVESPLCPFDAIITKQDGKGFQICFPVPVGTLGGRLPENIGCNIAVKTISAEGRIVKSSWVPAARHEFYSPYLWGELQLQERPLLMNRPLIAAILFGIGFLITLFISAIVMTVRKPGKRKAAAQSDADRQQFLLIKPEFDRKVIEKGVTIDAISKCVNMPPKKLALLIKQATGMSIMMFVMYARIEIAKERLRSSHASEESIAEACGFASVGEMDKQFMKFYRITPAKFRTEQQVA